MICSRNCPIESEGHNQYCDQSVPVNITCVLTAQYKNRPQQRRRRLRLVLGICGWSVFCRGMEKVASFLLSIFFGKALCDGDMLSVKSLPSIVTAFCVCRWTAIVKASQKGAELICSRPKVGGRTKVPLDGTF